MPWVCGDDLQQIANRLLFAFEELEEAIPVYKDGSCDVSLGVVPPRRFNNMRNVGIAV